MTDTTLLFLPSGDDGYRWWRIAGERVVARGEGVPAPDPDGDLVAVPPGDAVTLVAKGEAYRSIDDDLRAIEEFDQAITADPKLALAWWRRALARDAIGDKRSASDRARALQLDPSLAS